MKAIALFSGGKDSTLALFLALQKGLEASLLSIIAEKDSMMYHYPNISLTKAQAKAMDLPHFFCNEGKEKERIKELRDSYGAEALVCGAVKSDYQRVRLERLCQELGMKFYAPLWNLGADMIYNALFDSGFRFIITGVSADGFDENWLGREITRDNIDGLFRLCERYGINPVFEGGEAETFVFNGPLFKNALRIKSARKSFRNFYGIYEITELTDE